MLKCPKCDRTYDSSWSKCLACGIKLENAEEKSEGEGQNSAHYKLGGNRFLIVAYSVLLMIIAPILIFFFYMMYLASWKIEFIKHKDRELKKAIVTDQSKWKSKKPSDKDN